MGCRYSKQTWVELAGLGGVRVFSRLLSLFGIWKVVGGRQKGRREKGEGRRDGGGAIPVGSNVGP